MESVAHSQILKRVGTVLLIVGLLDIAVMIYCLVHAISYSSSFNIFAVIAGVFLLRGSLRAASVVRWLSMFMLVGFGTMVLASPLLQPWDLTVAEIRLNAWAIGGALIFPALALGLLVWLYRQLGKAPVLAARAAAGRPIRDMRVPALIGVGMVVVLTVSLSVFLAGETATKAKSIAAQQLGVRYRYHVSSLNIQVNSSGKFVSAVITAWNGNEVKRVPVHWEER